MRFPLDRIWRAAVAGAAAGLAGGLAMNRVIAVAAGAVRSHGAQPTRPAPAAESAYDATTGVGRMAVQELTAIRKQINSASQDVRTVHYNFAMAGGMSYGIFAEFSGFGSIAVAVLYSAALWFGADFVLLPVMGLSKSSGVYGWRVESVSLAGHLAYGAVLEPARVLIRRIA